MSRGGDWIHPATRMAIIWYRDGGRCLACPFRPARRFGPGLTLDHVVPASLWSDSAPYGPHDPSNLATLCASCQSRKGRRAPEDVFDRRACARIERHTARQLTSWHRSRGLRAALRVGRYRRAANAAKCRAWRARRRLEKKCPN